MCSAIISRNCFFATEAIIARNSGGLMTIKTPSYQYRNSHHKDETVVRRILVAFCPFPINEPLRLISFKCNSLLSDSAKLLSDVRWHSHENYFTSSSGATILYNECKSYTLKSITLFPRSNGLTPCEIRMVKRLWLNFALLWSHN